MRDIKLTAWEEMVADTLAQGHTRTVTARHLGTSEGSIQSAVASIRAKTGGKNLVHALLILSERGLIERVDTMREIPSLHPNAGRVAQALHVKLVSELNWREFIELRSAYETAIARGW